MTFDGFNFGIAKRKGYVDCESSIIGECGEEVGLVPLIIVGNENELFLQILDTIKDIVDESDNCYFIESEAYQGVTGDATNVYINPARNYGDEK